METENLATLDELRERLGAPADGTLAVMAPDSARERFIERGRQIGSPHIITDVTRIYGYACAYWQEPTPAERAALVGVSEELLRLAVDRAVTLRDVTLGRERTTHDEKVALAERTAAAREAFARGLGLRDQARTALRTVTTSIRSSVTRCGRRRAPSSEGRRDWRRPSSGSRPSARRSP